MPHRGTVPLKEAVSSLIFALDQRDPFGYGHAERCTRYAMRIGEYLSYPIERMAILQYGTLLHDVGKIGIPDFVLQSSGELTEDEFLIMQEHPQLGAMIVGKIELFQVIQPAILQHHERYDGNGYPSGLQDTEICEEARIINIVEAFDEMTTDRPYGKTTTPENALERIHEMAGQQFDPRLVKIFDKIITPYIEKQKKRRGSLTEEELDKLNRYGFID